MADEKKYPQNNKVVQNIIVENRERVSISGVLDVESFDETSITLVTELGNVVIKGVDLKVEKLNLEIGEVVAEGEFDSFEYTDVSSKKGGGLFSRMFK